MAQPVSRRVTWVVGAAALTFSALYFLSDVLEVAHGGFSGGQLWLTLVAEAAIPVFVAGLYLILRPSMGRLGAVGAWSYVYVYVFFTWTVVYALVEDTPDFDALDRSLSPWMVIHGAMMVLAGLCLGVAVWRGGALPRWPAAALMAGVVLVAIANGLPEGPQLVAAGIRDLGFAGMGLALVRGHVAPWRTPAPST